VCTMRTYPTPDDKVKQVLIAVLVLFGRPARGLRTWDDVKKDLSSQLTKELLALDVSDSSKGWAESARATCGLDIDAYLKEAPLPVAATLKWLVAVRLVRDVELGARKASAGGGKATAAVGAAVEAAGKAFVAASKVISPGKGAKDKAPRAKDSGSATARRLQRLPGAGRARMRIAAAVRTASKRAAHDEM